MTPSTGRGDVARRLEVLYTGQNSSALASMIREHVGVETVRAATREEVEAAFETWGPAHSPVDRRWTLDVSDWEVGIQWALDRFAGAHEVVVYDTLRQGGRGRGDAMAVISLSSAAGVVRWLLATRGNAGLRALPGARPEWVVLDAEDEEPTGPGLPELDPALGCTGSAYVPVYRGLPAP